MHSSRSRHSQASRALALCLIAAQFILFVATGLTHRHPIPSGSGVLASSPGRKQATPVPQTRLPVLRKTRHSDSSDCPICKVVTSTVVATAAAHPVALFAALLGQAPTSSPLDLPKLLVGLSSARAPPLV